jgi:hypothetical protein
MSVAGSQDDARGRRPRKRIPSSTMRRFAFALLLAATSCAHPQEPKGSHKDFERGEKILFARRAAELQECVNPEQPDTEAERTCMLEVQKTWKPIESFLIEMHRVWCDAKPSDCPTGGKLPDPPKADPPAKKKKKASKS